MGAVRNACWDQAEALPAEERAMLEKLLRRRRGEAWRRETAAAAKKAVREFRAGKSKSRSVAEVSARLAAASKRA